MGLGGRKSRKAPAPLPSGPTVCNLNRVCSCTYVWCASRANTWFRLTSNRRLTRRRESRETPGVSAKSEETNKRNESRTRTSFLWNGYDFECDASEPSRGCVRTAIIGRKRERLCARPYRRGRCLTERRRRSLYTRCVIKRAIRKNVDGFHKYNASLTSYTCVYIYI